MMGLDLDAFDDRPYDGIIARLGLGAVAAPNVSALAAALRALLGSREAWTQSSVTARHYYLRNHTVDCVMERFEVELVGPRNPRA